MQRTVPKILPSETQAPEGVKTAPETVSVSAALPSRPQKSASKRGNFCLSRIAEKLSLHVVVEGIENAEQESYLEAISPTLLGQGWLYGRPAGIAELRTRLALQRVRCE